MPPGPVPPAPPVVGPPPASPPTAGVPPVPREAPPIAGEPASPADNGVVAEGELPPLPPVGSAGLVPAGSGLDALAVLCGGIGVVKGPPGEDPPEDDGVKGVSEAIAGGLGDTAPPDWGPVGLPDKSSATRPSWFSEQEARPATKSQHATFERTLNTRSSYQRVPPTQAHSQDSQRSRDPVRRGARDFCSLAARPPWERKKSSVWAASPTSGQPAASDAAPATRCSRPAPAP